MILSSGYDHNQPEFLFWRELLALRYGFVPLLPVRESLLDPVRQVLDPDHRRVFPGLDQEGEQPHHVPGGLDCPGLR